MNFNTKAKKIVLPEGFHFALSVVALHYKEKI